MIAGRDLERRIADQQNDSGLIPLERFCRECGQGYIETPGEGACRNDCGVGTLTIFRKHPQRAAS